MPDIKAFHLGREEKSLIEQPSHKRKWMDNATNAYRCLPLVMANQLGWELRLTQDVSATWFGIPHTAGLRVHSGHDLAASHFGRGILTFHSYFLFRTPPDVNLLVTPPVNTPRKHIWPLEGYVETDWAHMSFTVNWIFTRAFRRVTFKAGDAICRILPYPRGFFESFDLEKVAYDEIPKEVKEKHEAWAWKRVDHLKINDGKMDGAYVRGAVQTRVKKGCPFHFK